MSNWIWYEHDHITAADQLKEHHNYNEAVELQKAATAVAFYMGNAQMESEIRKAAQEAIIAVNSDINEKAVWFVEDGY